MCPFSILWKVLHEVPLVLHFIPNTSHSKTVLNFLFSHRSPTFWNSKLVPPAKTVFRPVSEFLLSKVNWSACSSLRHVWHQCFNSKLGWGHFSLFVARWINPRLVICRVDKSRVRVRSGLKIFWLHLKKRHVGRSRIWGCLITFEWNNHMQW